LNVRKEKDMEGRKLFGLEGKVAAVTGASGGFGAEIARVLDKAGAKVALIGRDRRKLSPLLAELGEGATSVEGDVSREGEPERVVGRVIGEHGRLDILVNAAGGATVGGLMDLTDEAWRSDVDLKLFGYLRMMRAAAKAMRGLGGGRIVNVVGLAGHEPYHLLTAPSVMNAGLLALTKTAADELAPADITVNAVNPNAAATGLGDEMVENLAEAQDTTPGQVRGYLVGSTPMGRLVGPGDVAAAVLFYASDLSGFVTGTSLALDGGAHRAIA
jgi:NAD(P)-dependent dehydrogenase (short-subunit alcohol dehydrogenase family)